MEGFEDMSVLTFQNEITMAPGLDQPSPLRQVPLNGGVRVDLAESGRRRHSSLTDSKYALSLLFCPAIAFNPTLNPRVIVSHWNG